MKQLWFALILAGLTGNTAVGQSAQPAPAPATRPVDAEQQVERWIQGLSDDNWAERQAAEDGLIGAGDAAVARVKRLLDESDDPNLLASAENILAQIEQLRVEGPSRVTLHFDNADPKQVVDAIVQQTGQAIVLGPGPAGDEGTGRPITVHMDRAPLWVALREICNQTGRRPHDFDQPRTIVLVHSSENMLDGPSYQSGPFLVVATSAHEQRSMQLSRRGQLSASRTLQMMVFAEPKLAIIARPWQPVVEELVGADGKSYPPPRTNPGLSVGRDDWRWNLGMTLPADEGLTRIARLKGYLPVLRLVRAETRELDLTQQDIAGKELEAAGHRLVVQARENESDSVMKLKVTVHPRADGDRTADPLGQPNALMESISIVDANGQRLTRSASSGSGDMRAYEYELRYSRVASSRPGLPIGEPAKLVWRVPVEAREMKIPFEFTDIPLP